MNLDEKYMQMCIDLAKNGIGKTSPNPYVGSVIVRDGKILSTGFHAGAGLPHAEADALNKINDRADGATLYCNLEPCCHTNKRTPPCAQRIAKTGIKKVVIANLDPNPNVAGSGVKILEDAGIEVVIGILEAEGELLNEVFFTNMRKSRPFIHLKWAQTLDGKMATESGDSKWITNELSRSYVHKERNLYDAILVGANTVRYDNPHLTVRLKDQPVVCKKRIILSSTNNLPNDLNVFNDEFKKQTIIIRSFDELEDLFKQGIKSIYVEGGTQVLSNLIEQNLYDRTSVYIAPKILGSGKQVLQNQVKEKMKESTTLSAEKIHNFNDNILIESQRNICLQD